MKGQIWRTIITFVVVLTLGITTILAQYNKEYFLWMGRQLLIRGEYRDAISLLNTLINRDQKEYEGYFLRGIAKYNMGDLIGADSDLSQAIDHNPVFTQAYTYRAITRSRLGNYDDALNDFAEAIELRPDLPDPYYSRGVTRLLNQQFDEAIKDFDIFISQQDRVSDAYVNRGVCYLQLKDTTAAYRDFDSAIRTNRNSPEGYNRRGSLRLAQERLNEAEEDFNLAIKADSSHLPSLFNRAIVRNNMHQPEAALKDLDQVIRLDSMSSVSYFNRAIILSQIGDYNNALKDYDQVAFLSPENVLVYFYRANLLNRLGEVESAEDDYTRAIELYPDFANAYLHRSNIRFLLRDSKGAMADKKIAERKIEEHKSKLKDSTYSIFSDSTYRFDRLLSFDTKLSNFDTKSGNIASRGGELELIPLYRFTIMQRDTTTIKHNDYYNYRLDYFLSEFHNDQLTIDHRNSDLQIDSLKSIERALQREATRTDECNAHFELGVTQSLIKQYTSAISSLSRAIELEPNNPFLYINRSATRAEMIEFISSIESSFQRISIDSDPAKKLNNTTRSYDYEDALRDTERAIELYPQLAYNYYNLGGLLVISGRLPEAYDAYTEAIELYPSFAEAYYNRAVVQIMMKDTRKGCIDLSKSGELGVERAYKLLKKYSTADF